MEVNISEAYAHCFTNRNNIVKYPASILRQVSSEVEKIQDVKKLITLMSDTLRLTKGVGLAAPQVNSNKRVIMVRHKQRYALINPVIEEYSGEYVGEEGCLSIPALWGKVSRYQHITLRGISPHGKEVVLKLSDDEAVVPQHEIDHLDGILFIDRAIPDSLMWYNQDIDLMIPATPQSISTEL